MGGFLPVTGAAASDAGRAGENNHRLCRDIAVLPLKRREETAAAPGGTVDGCCLSPAASDSGQKPPPRGEFHNWMIIFYIISLQLANDCGLYAGVFSPAAVQPVNGGDNPGPGRYNGDRKFCEAWKGCINRNFESRQPGYAVRPAADSTIVFVVNRFGT